MYPQVEREFAEGPSKTEKARALQSFNLSLNSIYQRLSKLDERIANMGERAFGAVPSTDEKAGSVAPVNGLISELSYGLDAIESLVTRLENHFTTIERLV